MISFQHKLPAMYTDGKQSGTYNNPELVMPGALTTTDPRLGEFLHQLHNIVADDRRLVFINGKKLGCSLNWIRDHVHQMKAFKHWEYDIRSFLDFILDTQREDGQFFELIKQMDDVHWQFVHPESRILYNEDNLALVRLEIEADIEYLMVEGALQVYRVTGDLVWLEKILPRLEKGIDYMTSHPDRWDAELGLCKRAFTIDTWDFAYGRPGNNRKIEADTPMSIHHGDNTGVYQAMRTLAWMNRLLGYEYKAMVWEDRADRLRENIMRHLWNGKFFTHMVHLNHSGADSREEERLSLSNAYALHRDLLTTDQCRSIIAEYINRRETTEAFAEWFSIDPPYPEFNGYKPGRYVNGAISPFTAGELAKGAFRNGYEAYGWDIITRFMDLMERDGSIYFLYDPQTEEPQGGGPSGWGAAALLSAVDEGLAGIEDMDTGYRKIRFSPRFPVTPYTELRYITGYEKTDITVDLRWILTAEGMHYRLTSPAQNVQCHLYIPAGKTVKAITAGGAEIRYTLTAVGESVYADFETAPDGVLDVEVYFMP
ncbi:MAG: hypothetical protein IJ480_09515 [Clostridia bacterium]|nr:hypothetical protein [Clostridia bacterium]